MRFGSCVREFALRSVVFAALTVSFGSASAQTFLGCYKDQGDPQGLTGRDLSGSMSTSPTMTGAQCVAECTAKGLAYAGTQYGSYCFCGNQYGQFGPATCNSPCTGDAHETCGGAWANSVYAAASPPASGNLKSGSQTAIGAKLGRPSEGATIAPTQPAPGAPPLGLTAAAKGPAIAVLTWQAPAGSPPTGYDVYRSVAPSGASVTLNATPIAVTRFDDTSGGLDYRASYIYRVVAIYPGAYGRSEVMFQPPKPSNPDPKSLKTQLQGTNLIVSWAAVPGASWYGVAGDASADWREVMAPATSVTYPGISSGKHTYAVGAHYEPGNVTTPAAEWPRVTVTIGGGAGGPDLRGKVGGSGSGSGSSTASGCACKKTGAFAVPAFRPFDDDGVVGTFAHPSDGVFTVSPMTTSSPGIVRLSVTDSSRAVALDVPTVSGWGASVDGRFFVVIGALLGSNAGAPATVYKVAKKGFTSVLSTNVWPDGKWAFSADGSLFVVTRQEQAPSRYSFEVYNLTASNPRLAVKSKDELNTSGNLIAVSPCGDRFMHFRWTQLAPRTGQADFYARKDLGGAQTVLIADSLDNVTTPPTATVEAGMPADTFNVKLMGARLRNGATAFSSVQCSAP